MASNSEEQREKVSNLFLNEIYSKKKGFGISWPKICQLITDEIVTLKPKEVKILKAHSQWRRIFRNELGTDDIDWWIEMELIANHIILDLKSKSTISSEKITSLHQKINSKIHHSKTKIKYGIFPCQDTILPLFFEQSYNRNLDVEFVIFNNWSDGLKAFKLKTINVALHNFPTTVAFNSIIDPIHPLFFFPFFSFNGYGIFVKQNAIKEIAKKYKLSGKPSFNNLSDEAKIELFESSQIIVERKTDFEWAVLSFCDTLGCDKEKIKANFFSHSTNDAKEKFINNTNLNIYCTNPINIFDLERNAPKNFIELICLDDGLLEHHNFNGLICTVDFLNKNEDAVAEIIATWFNDIVRLKKELRNARTILNKNSDLILPQLTDFLNQQISTKISTEDLLNVFEGHNIFYETPMEAFNKFYHEVLPYDDKIFQNYSDIALIQLGKEKNANSEISEVMNLITNHMNSY